MLKSTYYNTEKIDNSMPISVCKFGRAYFSKSFKDISPYSYCDSKKKLIWD